MERIVIAGGGISGLYLAYRLTENINKYDVHIFETSDRLGGRIYEQRFHGFNAPMGGSMIRLSDTRVIKLCQELGLDLKRVDATLRSEDPKFINEMIERIINAYDPSKYDRDVSVTDFLRENFTTEEVERYVNGSIYRDYTSSSIHEYIMDYPITDHLQDSVSSFVVKGGYSRLIDALVASIKDKVTIHLNTPVERITNNYVFTNGGRSRKRFDRLFWTVTDSNKHILRIRFPNISLMNTVYGVPFLKMYAYVDAEYPTIVVGGLLGKVFSLTKNILMVAYTDNKYAEELYNIIKDLDQQELKTYVQTMLRTMKGFETVSIQDIVYKYWKVGIHQYKSYPTNIRQKYDNVVLIGEAVSRNHGWAEGAIESVDKVI